MKKRTEGSELPADSPGYFSDVDDHTAEKISDILARIDALEERAGVLTSPVQVDPVSVAQPFDTPGLYGIDQMPDFTVHGDGDITVSNYSSIQHTVGGYLEIAGFHSSADSMVLSTITKGVTYLPSTTIPASCDTRIGSYGGALTGGVSRVGHRHQITNSLHAKNADSATHAGHALKSDSANHAGTATHADYAGHVDNPYYFPHSSLTAFNSDDHNQTQVGFTYVLCTGNAVRNAMSGVLGDGSSNISLDPNNRKLYNSGASFTVDWQAENLVHAAQTTVDWNNLYLQSSGSVTVDWGNKALKSGGNVTLDWGTPKLVTAWGCDSTFTATKFIKSKDKFYCDTTPGHTVADFCKGGLVTSSPKWVRAADLDPNQYVLVK